MGRYISPIKNASGIAVNHGPHLCTTSCTSGRLELYTGSKLLPEDWAGLK